METKYEQWKIANAFIEEINEKSKSSGNPDALLLEHNLTSDWTDEQYAQYFRPAETLSSCDGQANSSPQATEINHEKFIGELRDVECNLDYATAGLLAVEGAYSIKKFAKNPQPMPHLSM